MHQKITAMCTVYSFPLVHHYSPATVEAVIYGPSRHGWFGPCVEYVQYKGPQLYRSANILQGEVA